MERIISVVVPAYNVEPYLSRCVNSLLNQKYSGVEIIIVNDGSSDGTDKIAKAYSDKYPGRVKYISQINKGVTAARLQGVLNASGGWIGFVDGDDEVEPDMYERLYANAVRFNADISHCGYQTIVNEGERIHYFYNTGRLVQQDKNTGIRDLIEGVFIEPGLCNKIYKKELLLKLINSDLMDRSIRMNEDLLMNYYLFSFASHSVFEDFCPYHYLSRASSVTRSEFRLYKELDPVRVRKIIVDTCDAEMKDYAIKKLLLCCINVYQSLYHRNEFHTEAEIVKNEIMKYRQKWNVLSMKHRVKLYLAVFIPDLYTGLYSVYRRFRKRKYE